MKKSIIALILSCAFLTSCEDKTEDVSTVVNVSYPIITLNGDEVVSTGIATGAYVDPGATGTDDITGATSSLSPVSNNVDLTAPGFYSVKYTMKNSNGYITTKIRLVLVTPVDPATDLSGTYFRTSNNQTVTVTKRGTGLYTTDNVGGVPNAPQYIFDVYFGQITDSTIEVPSQPNPLGGEVYCNNTSLVISPADTSFSWIVRGSGFGTAQRTFSHQ
jgi:hypothetical protein